MAAYVHDHSFFTRRGVVFMAIIAIHVLLIYGFASGMASKMIAAVAPPIQTTIINQVQKHNKPPPPPPPKMERPPVRIPPPEVAINIPQPTNSTAITNVTTKPQPPAPPPPPPPVKRVAPRLNLRASPSTADYYPPTSRRLGEQGTTTVHFCVASNGRVVGGSPKVQKSSGSRRLDEAALRWTTHARFSPGTANGKPVEMCSAMNVKFVLQ